MMENPCLRPATSHDVLWSEHIHLFPAGQFQQAYETIKRDLTRLYNAEWKLRGYHKEP